MPITLKPISQLIRSGKLGKAKEALALALRRRPKREKLATLASLCRRSGLAGKGVSLLHPIVHPPPSHPATATGEEKAEYAACLTRIGAQDEALELLLTLDEAELPEVSLYRAFAHIRRWEYERSVPCLEAYLAHPRARRYQKLVARVNLAAALVIERKHAAALPLLRRLIHDTSVRKNRFLCGNVLEIATESFVLQRKLADARRTLAKAKELLADTAGVYELFVRKWEAVIELAASPRGSGGALEAIREEALRRGYWESVRDCDRFAAMLGDRTDLAARLIAGTPYPAFRERLVRDLGKKAPPPGRYAWRGEATEDAPVTAWVDVATGETSAREGLRPDSMLHRFFIALGSDFYRPLDTAALFRASYPGERFHPESSPHRIYQLVRSARKWLAGNALPVELEQQEGAYRLRFRDTGACFYVGGTARREDDRRTASLEEALRSHFGDAVFSTPQAARHLGLSERSALRVVTDLKARGAVERVREGKTIRYRLRSGMKA